MKITDLTLPLQDGMNYYCTGHLPWEVPFKAQHTVPKESKLDLGSFTMYSEPGTRYLCVLPKKLGDVFKNELNKLVMKDAVMLHVPKESKEENLITAEEMKAGINMSGARDAIILHRAWR